MKVKVTKDCYYNLEYIKAGRIIDFKGDKLPSWAEAIGKKDKQDKSDSVGQENQPKDETPDNTENDGQNELDNVGQNQDDVNDEKPSLEAMEYLNRLIDEGIEKNILIEDADKKTVQQQIDELEKLLGRKK